MESILVEHDSVIESAAIGVPHPIKGSAAIVFCVLGKDVEANDELHAELRTMVATAMGKPLAPQSILFISDLPKTRNGKVMRRMIRSEYLVNGGVLEEIESLSE